MKYLNFLILSFFLYSCGSDNLESFFIENTNFPYVIDSAFLSSIDETQYQQLEGNHLKTLFLSLKQAENQENNNIIMALIEKDSLIKANVAESEIEDKFWEFKNSKILALHKLSFESGIKAYSWYIYFDDGNQGHSKVIVTLYKDNKPYSCFQLADLFSYSDSPAWNEGRTNGEISAQGKVSLDTYVAEGEYVDNEQQIDYMDHNLAEFSIETGEITDITNKNIASYHVDPDADANQFYIIPVSISSLNDLFSSKSNFPVEIDSTFIIMIKYDSNKKLDAGQVKTLFENGDDLAEMQGKATAASFIELDSLAQQGLYDEYVQNIKAGMMMSSEAYALIKLTLEEGIDVYIWYISDATSEFGPHSSGMTIFASFIKGENVLSSYPIAELSRGGDSPAWDRRKIECGIKKDGELQITYQYTYGDDESGDSETSRAFYNFLFKNGKLEKLPDLN